MKEGHHDSNASSINDSGLYHDDDTKIKYITCPKISSASPFTTEHVEVIETSPSSTAASVNANEKVANMIDRQAQEKRIVRSLDRRMMPLFCVFFFADFLDRANIGNAAIAGIQTDLHLSATQLGFAISAFYITYILFEIPSNVILKRTRASVWLSSIMLAWGIATIVLAFVSNFTGLVICRLILGAAQSGYIPAILYQMSLVYKPTEINMRVACLLTMASLSGIVSGPLAYASSFLEGRRGLHGWQYLFILEGTPTVALSIVSYFCLFDDITKVKWLTDEQKALQLIRMADSSPPCHGNVTLRVLIRTFSDWKVWMFSAVYFLTVTCMTSLAIFLPTIISGFGYPTLTSQLLTAPPAVVCSLFTLLGGYLTDRYNFRTPLLMCGFSVTAVSYALLLTLHDSWALYGSLFLLETGMGLTVAAVVGWSAVNFPDSNIRAVAVATVVMVGNMGSVAASFLYPSSNGPHHYFGNAFCLTCAVLDIFVCGLTGFLLYRANRRHGYVNHTMDVEYKETSDKQGVEYCYHY